MKPLAFLLLGALAGGCVYSRRAEWESTMASRAAFEMNCPREQLRIIALTEATFGATDAPLNEGVEGCGRRAVYVATISGYVLNSGQGPNGPNGALYAPPPPPPPPPPPVK
jgi:hypothetical protein